MNFGLKGHRALVLGGGSGLGRGIAGALAGEGADVIVSGRTQSKLDEAVSGIVTAGGSARALSCDLADAASIDEMCSGIGDIDILINNCGGPPPGPIVDVADDVWLKQFEIMFLGNCRLVRHLLPGMRAQGWGRVVNVVSSGVLQPIPNLGISNALRLAVVGWSKTLAAEVAADGVTVNCLAPGRIHTDRVDQLDAGAARRTDRDIEEVRTASRAGIPLGRYGRAEEFAAYAAFLCSEPASYVTGTVHRADGGMIRGI
ncbi:SDR family oxidoreductase [Oceanibium sediminis]|uniref:SDR family oxidoreductase n=1 Tax=Oceanibium sediminis TaxID=2026339 RepID=UPI000DD2BDF4|nr:SDR family oxidoreductase [Oceanibium sediminis]